MKVKSCIPSKRLDYCKNDYRHRNFFRLHITDPLADLEHHLRGGGTPKIFVTDELFLLIHLKFFSKFLKISGNAIFNNFFRPLRHCKYPNFYFEIIKNFYELSEISGIFVSFAKFQLKSFQQNQFAILTGKGDNSSGFVSSKYFIAKISRV